MVSRLGAEAVGTFWLVLGGCGTAVLAGSDVGFLGVSLAFGLAVLTAAYAVGHVSGGHFNPAVSVGLAVAGRFAWRDVPAYAAAQVGGAALGAAVLFVIASGADGFSRVDGFAANGYGEASPGGYGLLAALVTEMVMTAVFVLVILGATDTRAPRGFAPIAIGLALTLVHLVSIPVTNTSVNPARSVSQALFAGGVAVEQLWLFVVAPLVGAALAALLYHPLLGRVGEPVPLREAQQA